ncbi:hypothetical protein [Streptomyces tendae]|uniref:hypothetical protein n=1 Tax=Streptomyces tendae TaxID=1932 RepID=UPI0024930525|nr:hypothetical protein [Streptomyces tendae]
MNAAEFNASYPVGTLVFAYPGCRPEDGAGTRLVTRTRTAAQLSASGDPVVWVEGEGSYISLTHVDPVAQDVWEEAREAETAAQAPEPTGMPKTAREKVAGLLWWSVPSPTDDGAKALTNQFLNELAAEVVAERDAQFVAWLLKRSREDEHGDVIARLASKVARGAVRADNLNTLDLPAPDDPHLSAVATIEKALHAYYEDTPSPRLTTGLLLANALCGERAAASAAYRDAAYLVAQYATGSVTPTVMRDLADELQRRAREAS